MRQSSFRWLIGTLVLVWAIGAVMSLPRASAQSPAETQSGKPLPPRPAAIVNIRVAPQPGPRICKALLEPTNFEFVDEPLLDVVDYLKDLHNIEIQIDAKALEAASIGTDMPVTCNLKGIALRPALDLMLKQLKLAYFIEGEVLMITNEQPSEPRLSVRLYDCSWARPDQRSNLPKVIDLLNSGRTADAVVAEEHIGDNDPSPSASAFRVVPYGSWLAVRASDVEHETVRRLLAELRSTTESDAATATDKIDQSAVPTGTRP